MSSSPASHDVTVGTPLAFPWAAEPPESGWTVTGYEYCLEGWFKPADSENITCLSGYTPGMQPWPVW